MRYEGTVYRPPSEADSLLIQATIGCPHNRCAFCGMYRTEKFRIRPVAEIKEDLRMAQDKIAALKIYNTVVYTEVKKDMIRPEVCDMHLSSVV